MVQINVGAGANDGTGDPLRTAFQKVNANTTELGLSITTSSDSTFNGVKVGLGLGNQSNNVVVGSGAGVANTTGNFNSFFGNYAALKNTTGYNNTFNGQASGAENTTGFNNSFFGKSAGSLSVSGNNNTYIGQSAGQNTLSNYNTFVGGLSGRSASSGSGNTFLGFSSGLNVSSGSYNTFLGIESGSSSNYVNSSGLGYNSQVTGNNQVQLGNADTTTYVYGTVQNRSDLRDKSDVQDTVLGLDFISKLRPVDYKWDMREYYKSEYPIQGELSDEDFKVVMDLWLIENKLANLKHNGTKKRNRFHHGFIAQEVKDLGFGGFQDHSKNGGEDVLSIGYDEFIAPMVKAIQELKAEIELLKKK